MKTLSHFTNKAESVQIIAKGEQVELISKKELVEFITKVFGQKFTTKGAAKRLTGLSYLLGIDSSAKTVKGLKKDIHTAILYLQPYKTAFGNLCPMGAPCFSSCLSTSGRVTMDTKEFKILRARYFKTVLFYVNRDFFNAWLHSEIETAANRYGKSLVVRLNGTSDLSPVLFGNVLEKFPNVQFYDYTKILNRSDIAAKYANYHLTFSYSGYNAKECTEAIQLGLNVAIVIDGKQPVKFDGTKVFSMDETDLRPFDKQRGNYGYLKLKRTLNQDYNDQFIIPSTDNRLQY